MALATSRPPGNKFNGIKKTVYFYVAERGGYYTIFIKDTELNLFKILGEIGNLLKSLWIIKITFPSVTKSFLRC